MPTLLRPPTIVIKDFLSAADHAAMLDWTMQNEPNYAVSTVVGKAGESKVNEYARKSVIFHDMGPMKRVFKDRVRADYKGWIRDLRSNDFELQGSELEIVAHNDGAHFSFHTDTVLTKQIDGRSHRVLSAVYYFHNEPKAFEGGQLRLFPFGTMKEDAVAGTADPQVFEPAQNTLVIFPSWAPHDVTQVTVPSKKFADSRFAVNCWLHRTNVAAATEA